MKNALTKFIIFLTSFCIILLAPMGFTTPSQSQTKAIVTALGIDYTDNEIELSAQIVLPESSNNSVQKYQSASGKGENISESVKDIEMQIGKTIGLAHCFTIILSQSICDNYNIMQVLDYFARNNDFSSNAILVNTDIEAKKLLEQSTTEDKSTQDILQDLTEYNHLRFLSLGTDLYSFYNNSLSQSATTYMYKLSINENTENSGSGQSGGESSGSEEGSPSTSQDIQIKTIKNNGDIAIFHKGNYVCDASSDDLKGFNWLDTKTQNDIFLIPNITNKILKNANINLQHLGSIVRLNTSLKNNQPILNIDLITHARIISIKNNETLPITNANYLKDESVQISFNTLVYSEIQKSMNLQKEKGFDLLNLYHLFEMQQGTKWYNYLNTLIDSENYLQNIEVYVNTQLIEQS